MAFAHNHLPSINLWALQGVEKDSLLALIKENQGDTTKLALARKVLDILKKETPSEPEEDKPMPI